MFIGQQNVDGSGFIYHIYVLVAKHFVGFNGHQHAAVERCLKQRFYPIALYIIIFIERNFYFAFGVYLKTVVIGPIGAVAVKMLAYIG